MVLLAGWRRMFVALVLVGAGLAACVSPQMPAGDSPAAEAGGSDPAAGESAAPPVYESWDAVLAAAEGTTVNWFVWGGADTVNTHVDTTVARALEEQHGVTLNRVPVEATGDAVNKALNEKAAGLAEGGSMDLVWINGENFRTLKEADLLYGPFVELLPNTEYVDWENPSVAYDFGVAVEGYESPWASFQFVFEYNTATVGDRPPQTYEELAEWIEANPGRFTYPAPPNHVGSAFVRQLFYWAAGSAAPFLGPFDQAVYDEYAPVVWAYLNRIEPHLWREGDTYPDVAAMADLLANREIDFAMEYDASRASSFIAQGRYPETIRTFTPESGTVSNISYVAIPFNAANPAGALATANHLLSPTYQVTMSHPDELGWMPAIDPARLDEAARTELEETPRGPATLSPEALREAALPEVSAEWVDAIDDGWAEEVLR